MADEAQAPGYRWVIVAASALILALAMGSMVNGMSAYVVPMEQAFGWQRAEISLINVSGIIGIAFGGLVMGPLADRKGPRPVVLTGVVVLGLCYLAAGIATAPWQFYVLMLVAGFFGGASVFAPLMALVGNWFPVGAGLAIGIAAAGQAFGQGSVPYASALLIEKFGIGTAFTVTGIAMLAVLVPLALLLRQPTQTAAGPATTESGEDGYLPERIVIPTMCTAVILCCTCMSVPLMHLVPLIQDHGIPLEQAGQVIFAMLMVGIAGRAAFGKLADVIGALPAYMASTVWMTVLVYGFVHLETLWSFRMYSAVYGFGYAGVMTGVLVSTSALTRPSRRATALGIVGMFAFFGHANGGYLGGLLFDLSGTYTLSYATAATAGVLNLMIVGWLFLKTRSDLRSVSRPAH